MAKRRGRDGAFSRNVKNKNLIKKKKKKRRHDESSKTEADEASAIEGAEAGDEEPEDEEDGDDTSSDDGSEGKPPPDMPPEGETSKKSKHIRPCVCDLTESAMRRIATHHQAKRTLHEKYVTRRAEIEEEIRQKEAEAKERERERAEQKELFGDEYEMTQDGHKKRKKRSARRASMVSLGVRQVINWRKEPKIKVVFNKTWHLRHDNARYCGKLKYLMPIIEIIDYKKEPKIQPRLTNTYNLRHDHNLTYIDKLGKTVDTRPPFILEYIP